MEVPTPHLLTLSTGSYRVLRKYRALWSLPYSQEFTASHNGSQNDWYPETPPRRALKNTGKLNPTPELMISSVWGVIWTSGF